MCSSDLYGITESSMGYVNFMRLISSWARKRSPDGDLPFTTISLNKNYAGKLHRDSGNIGPSVGVAIGDYTGGNLHFWPDDSKKGTRSSNVMTPSSWCFLQPQRAIKIIIFANSTPNPGFKQKKEDAQIIRCETRTKKIRGEE